MVQEVGVIKYVASYKVAASLACLAILGPLAIDTYLPAFHEIAHDLNTSFFNIQQTLTFYIIAFAVCNLFHGVLSDVVGRRPVILGAFLLFAFASFGAAFATTWDMLLVFRVLQGATAGAGVVVAHAIARDCFEGAEALRMVAYGAATFSIVPALSPVIGGYLLAGFGWRSIFVFLGVLALIMSATSWRFLLETHPPCLRSALSVKTVMENYRVILARSDFYILTMVVSLNYAAAFVYIASAPAFLMQHLGVSSKGFGWLFLPLLFGNMLGAWVSGKIASRWSPAVIIRCGYIIMVASAVGNVFLCLFVPPRLLLNIVPLVIYVFGMALAAPAILLMLLDRFPRCHGTASSIRGFLQNMLLAVVAGLVSPIIYNTLIGLSATMLVIVLVSSCCWRVFVFDRAVRWTARSTKS